VVTLGKLKNVKEFQALPCLSRVVASKPKAWVLPDQYCLSYPEGKTISLTEKETLKIPFKHKELKITNFSILRVTSDGSRIVENMYSNAKLVKNKNSSLGINYVQISGLEEGKYQVWLKKEDVRFTVVVHDGKHWDVSNDFILKKRCLLYRGHQKLDALRIDKAELV